ncbi:MAG: esterase-like activity of phytase family protein [Phycisphaerales bacterium]|nr:esterase-like activity of phytase family protein [Phycisphaerales bacterium]
MELFSLGGDSALALERPFTTGVGNTIKLFEVSFAGAPDISAIESLEGMDLSQIPSVSKTLLLDFATLGITLDNIEGMTFGSVLEDGRQSLIIVSDTNFAATQFTQVMGFALTVVPAPGAAGVLLIAGLVAGRRRLV